MSVFNNLSKATDALARALIEADIADAEVSIELPRRAFKALESHARLDAQFVTNGHAFLPEEISLNGIKIRSRP